MKFPVCPNMIPEDSIYSSCVGCQIKEEHNMGCPLKRINEGVYEFVGETPAGGKKALLYFTIEGKQYRDKDVSKFVEIQELDGEGRLIAIEHAFADPNKETIKPNK
ncbi:MAG: hypothetical protein JXR48_18825 [Candidatus Delongbacteria bacterium]|nr:hypothetical protein [Candidatus Delongbacteria bacterium]MBN2837014.1 hypothetical protein [Candidatus Delongbacteria bacterium]